MGLAGQDIERALHRDAHERVDDPRFVELLVDIARQAIFAGREELARRLLETASHKLQRIAHASPLYDRVDEVQYLLHELDEGEDEGRMEGVTHLFDEDGGTQLFDDEDLEE